MPLKDSKKEMWRAMIIIQGAHCLLLEEVCNLECILFIDFLQWVSSFHFFHYGAQYIEDNLKHLPRLNLVEMSPSHSLVAFLCY